MSAQQNRYRRKLCLILSGQAGAHLVSIAALAGMRAAGVEWLLLLEMAMAVILVRSVYCMTRGPRPVIPGYRVRRRIAGVVTDEVKIGLVMAAACYLLRWPVSEVTFALFFGLNVIGQAAAMYLTRRILTALCTTSETTDQSQRCKQVLVVGTGVKGKALADTIMNSPELDAAVAGFLDYRRRGLWRYRDIPLIGHPDEIDRIVANCHVDALFIAVEPEDLSRCERLFSTVEKMGVPVCFSPEIFQPTIARVRGEQLRDLPLLVYCASPESQCRLAVKWLIDKAGALAGIILSLPLLLVVAAAVKLDSKGPVLFKQARSGLNGKLFNMYKFRTMCRQAEKLKDDLVDQNEMSGPVFKIKDDPRVTRLGRLLRKTSLDELPQLFNVLKGDMSLVGPRPPLPSEVACYEPWQRRRLSVRPGVTCTWQVSGRNNIDFDNWMRLDLEYIDNWSLLEDTRILAKTVPAVLKGSGAS